MTGKKSGKRKAESGRPKAEEPRFQLSAFSFQLSSRRGFTLIELLVVITIIGILASIVLATLAQTRETARVARTKATIAKLNAIVMAQYASYRTRRVPLPMTDAATGKPLPPKTAARLRLAALRQLMRLEMPERSSDIVYPWPPVSPPPTNPAYLSDNADDPINIPKLDGSGVFSKTIQRPALSRAYLRRWTQSVPDPDYLSSELLYLIVTLGTPDARSQFMESEIGDADGDTWPEFLDGWGNPIAFLRWAPGFTESDVQLNAPVTDSQAQSDHDPFDPRRMDTQLSTGAPSGWRLIPLIYSAGPDGVFDINWEANYFFRGNPYYHVPLATPNDAGAPVDSANTSVTAPGPANGSLDHYDNIHNHRIEAN